MELEGKRIGFALTGSFCTLSKIMTELEELKKCGADVFPIMSEVVWSTDTRFGKAQDIKEKVTSICEREIIHTIVGAEPIGPKHILDALVIAPCTGNTLSKIAMGITDSCVSMAAKANLRNKCPLVIAISTNDGLGANGKNIGILFNVPNVYFVPFGQDDPTGKPDSLVADVSLISKTLEYAFDGVQLQPLLKGKKE
ncbi:MAG: dipicolinate synthase subunit B [Clostridia bacterium]|nr:dipicolinate synthase subunit B [Clostridia bacterium]